MTYHFVTGFVSAIQLTNMHKEDKKNGCGWNMISKPHRMLISHLGNNNIFSEYIS